MQFALIIVGVGVVGALLSYCSNLTTVKVLTKTTMASIYEGMDNLLETDLVIAEKLDFSYITQRLFQDANVITSFVLSNFLSIFLNGTLIVGVLYCFFVIDPLLCLIVVVVLIPYIVLFLALKRPLFDSSEKKKEADSRLFGSIHSIVEQVFSIQLNSRFSGRAKDNPNIVPTDAQYRWLVQNINEVNLTGKCHPCIDVKWGDPIDHLVRFRDTNYFMDQVSVHANGDIVVSAYLPLVVGNVRKRSLSDYWNAGLKTIWATNVVQYLTARMQSVSDMENITTLISDINMDGCLNLDLMENDLNDLNLIKGVILEEWM